MEFNWVVKEQVKLWDGFYGRRNLLSNVENSVGKDEVGDV